MMGCAILLQIVPDSHTIAHCDVLIENRPANLALPADDAVVENEGVFDDCAAPDLDTSPEYRVPHYAA
jgi:hypothetical protein